MLFCFRLFYGVVLSLLIICGCYVFLFWFMMFVFLCCYVLVCLAKCALVWCYCVSMMRHSVLCCVCLLLLSFCVFPFDVMFVCARLICSGSPNGVWYHVSLLLCCVLLSCSVVCCFVLCLGACFLFGVCSVSHAVCILFQFALLCFMLRLSYPMRFHAQFILLLLLVYVVCLLRCFLWCFRAYFIFFSTRFIVYVVCLCCVSVWWFFMLRFLVLNLFLLYCAVLFMLCMLCCNAALSWGVCVVAQCMWL